MQTRFTPDQLADPEVQRSERILRKCVHCGFCTATCPTYLLLGDEADSPRGRIYLIQDMLETGGAPPPSVVKHVDRCLSCLSCATTCPSGVDYMHLVDHARAYIEAEYERPWPDRALRLLLSTVLTRAWLFRLALTLGARIRWASRLAPGRLKGVLAMAPPEGPPRRRSVAAPARETFSGAPRARVGLVKGCVQPVLAPQIDEATWRLLTRMGVEVVEPAAPACCGALPHHLGKTERSHELAKAQIAYWHAEIEARGLDAIVSTTSGCGVTLKDYGEIFRNDPVWRERAAAVSARVADVCELLERLGPPAATQGGGVTVAYHSACSLQHGQGLKATPRRLLEGAGFKVVEPREAHICCGSAGVYNLLQPDLAGRLRDRKAAHLEALDADVVAAGNIGCIAQIGGATARPIVHTLELLDWATGGPMPLALTADAFAARRR